MLPPAVNWFSHGKRDQRLTRLTCRQVAAGLCGTDATGEQVEPGSTIALALDQLQAADLALALASRRRGGQRGIDGCAVGADAVRQRDEQWRTRCAADGFAPF